MKLAEVVTLCPIKMQLIQTCFAEQRQLENFMFHNFFFKGKQKLLKSEANIVEFMGYYSLWHT